MIVSVPKVSLFHLNDVIIAIAHLPLIAQGGMVEKLRSDMRLSSCTDPLICLPSIYGGVIIFKGTKPLLRAEYDGFFSLRGEDCSLSVKEFVYATREGREGCLKVQEGTLVLSPNRLEGGEKVDVIGLRFIVD
jgi:hypothetical protein